MRISTCVLVSVTGCMASETGVATSAETATGDPISWQEYCDKSLATYDAVGIVNLPGNTAYGPNGLNCTAYNALLSDNEMGVCVDWSTCIYADNPHQNPANTIVNGQCVYVQAQRGQPQIEWAGDCQENGLILPGGIVVGDAIITCRQTASAVFDAFLDTSSVSCPAGLAALTNPSPCPFSTIASTTAVYGPFTISGGSCAAIGDVGAWCAGSNLGDAPAVVPPDPQTVPVACQPPLQ